MKKIHREKIRRGRNKKEEGSQSHTIEISKLFAIFFSLKAKLRNNLHKFLHDRRASIIEPRNAKYYSRVRLNVTFHWSAFRAHFFGLLSGEINWMPFFKIILFILSLTNWSSTEFINLANHSVDGEVSNLHKQSDQVGTIPLKNYSSCHSFTKCFRIHKSPPTMIRAMM